MIISDLKIYNFRRFQSVNGAPGLHITFHKGLNALIGENDSGKTAVIDALKLVLLTQSNEYIRPVDEDFYRSVGAETCSEFRIDCTMSEFTQNEAKNFIEYLTFEKKRIKSIIHLNFIIALGKMDIKFFKNYEWVISMKEYCLMEKQENC